jgi:hypothetical protein
VRTHLSDGPTDKLSYRKRGIGIINGTNLRFKTFEYRRITDLSTATAPLGVFVNGSPVSVSSDDVVSGEFVLAVAPIDGDVVEASYYSQWFVDTEFNTFLKNAAQWSSLGEDFTTTPPGLQPALLDFCGHLAYRKLSLFWARAISETFMFQEAPQKDRFQVVDSYTKLAADFEKRATSLRNDYYSRQGQSLQPLFISHQGNARDVPPRS